MTGIAAANKKVQQTKCAHNLRQLDLAVQVFITDSHVYPLGANPAYFKGGYPEHQTAWMTALEGVLARGNPVYPPATNSVRANLWQCPSAPRPLDYPGSLLYVSYGYNENGLSTQGASMGLGGQNVWLGGPDGSSPPVKDSEIANPRQLMVLGDGFKAGKGLLVDGLSILMRDDAVQDPLGGTRRAFARHRQKTNVAFCDGHVESPTLKYVFEDNTDAGLARWNRDSQPHRELLKP